MAEEHHQKSHEYEPTVAAKGSVESKDRGMFDFLGKKEEEKPQHHQQQEVMATEFEKVHVSEPKVEEEEKKPGLLEKPNRSNSSSCSSSDEEEGDDEEKKKKRKEKKGLKEKLKDKISGKEEETKHEDTTVPVEKVDEEPHHQEQAHTEERGFLDKVKGKLPGQHKKPEDKQVPSPPPAAAPHNAEHVTAVDKIKEKLPGQHKKPEDQQVPSPPPAAAPHHAEHVTAESHNFQGGEAKEKKGILEKLKEHLPDHHDRGREGGGEGERKCCPLKR